MIEMTEIQERRLISAEYAVPGVILLSLLLMMALTIAIVIVLVIDLDQPARGLIQAPTQALVDVAKDIQP